MSSRDLAGLRAPAARGARQWHLRLLEARSRTRVPSSTTEPFATFQTTGRADRRLAAEAAIAPPSSGGERAAKLAVIESGWLGDTDHRVRCAVDALGRWLRGRAFGDRAWLNRARPVARRVDGAIETWLGDLLACAGSLCWQWRL